MNLSIISVKRAGMMPNEVEIVGGHDHSVFTMVNEGGEVSLQIRSQIQYMKHNLVHLQIALQVYQFTTGYVHQSKVHQPGSDRLKGVCPIVKC